MHRRGYRPHTSRALMDHHRRRLDRRPIGLVAGWGAFPIEVARGAIADGHGVVCIALSDHASPSLESICDHVRWAGVGRVGTHVRYFRRHGVRRVAMAGKLFKTDILYSGPVLWKHRPDLTAVRTFGPLLFGRRKDARDDRLLSAVTDTYNRSGLTVCPATDLAPELLVNEGHLAGPTPNRSTRGDADAGWRAAKLMGGLDVGQTVTVKDGTVIAVEAIEGTDRCIERTGTLCRGGWTMVKVAKPDQDMRFDVPTVGPRTIENVAAAGGRAIVIEAGMTIVVEQPETYAAAKRLGVSLIAMNDPAEAEIARAA